ncbi:MAG TPA: hypothetical protein VFQ73_16310 [Flavisolibacter sp.]|nr:hypothetical protein [Flavisolibacter sp.]
MKIEDDKLIPENQSGIETNTESEKSFPTEDEAKAFYQLVKQRLTTVNKWHQFAGQATADFQLTDASGVAIDRWPQQGDHFKINIHAPGSTPGDGYDWVRIEAIDETVGPSEESVIITVRPATSPLNSNEDIAHFFSDEATSSFAVKRYGNKVMAGVYGRNEKPNSSTEKIIDKVRNVAIATGAITGFSKIQWKSLVNGLLKDDT